MTKSDEPVPPKGSSNSKPLNKKEIAPNLSHSGPESHRVNPQRGPPHQTELKERQSGAMYIILEYVAYVGIVGVLGALLFGASAAVLITREGAKQAALTLRRLAARARQTHERYRNVLPIVPHHSSQESH